VPITYPGNLKYARPSDIITSTAAWTAAAGTVSTDANYGLAAMYDRKMSRPLKFTDGPVVAVRVVGDFGVATRLDGLALPNHNLPAGTAIRAEMNDTNVWTAPAVSVAMPPGTDMLDGHRASPWADFTAASGYTSAGFRYVSLYVPATAVVQQIGELLALSHLRSFSQFPQFKGTKGTSRQYLEAIRTEYGVRRVSRRAIKQRQFQFSLFGSDADYADLQTLADDATGLAAPFFMVADSSIKTDGGLYGRFTDATAAMLSATEEWYDVNTLTIAFMEDSRSLPL
jgi:hypothetical protein